MHFLDGPVRDPAIRSNRDEAFPTIFPLQNPLALPDGAGVLPACREASARGGGVRPTSWCPGRAPCKVDWPEDASTSNQSAVHGPL